VILTGGDPLILTSKKLSSILSALNDIPHVYAASIHTRIPVLDSKRINTEMLKALKTKKALFIVLHANHPKEFTPEALEACARIINAGIPMLSQSVLLKGINDNPETMKQLLRCFVKNRIKPYYLHHADLTKGTSHFRTSLETGRKLMKELRGDISGLCQPTYVLDIPGGYGKAPLSPCYIHGDKQDEKNHYLLEDYQGNLHSYTEDLESD
jgi:lysine 2,3-aminomutase